MKPMCKLRLISTAAVFFLSLAIADGKLQAADLPANAEDLAKLRDEVKALEATVKMQAKKIADLKAENANLKATTGTAPDTKHAMAGTQPARATSQPADRFAEQRRARKAKLQAEIARLRKCLDDEKKDHRLIAIYGLETIGAVMMMESELKEITQRPKEWAPLIEFRVGAIGRFKYDYVTKVVSIIDSKNMIVEVGSYRVWIAGFDTSRTADDQLVEVPGVFKMTGNKKYWNTTYLFCEPCNE